jgi:flagellar protein FliT
MATPDDCNAPASDLACKRRLIERILENDAEVRRHTEPWMEHVRQFLGNGVRRRDVEKAYAAGAGESAAGGFGT